MVMGPTCGMVLADLGAEVIKVEPIDGDRTRRLLGRGRRLLPDVQPQQEEHRDRPAAAPRARRSRAGSPRAPTSSPRTSSPARWASTASTTRRWSQVNPRLIYVSHKGFLPGPYEHRTALDEVVQMMGGLAYMTGRPGDPLRAGTSVNDIMGGMFGAIGALGRADPARRHGPRHGSAVGAVREQRVPGRPAHAAVRDDRQGAGADARARQPVGGLRRVHGQGRRADLPRRRQRRAVGDVLRRARASPTSRPIPRSPPTTCACRRAPALLETLARAARAALGRRARRAVRARRACPSRRSAGPRTSTTIRTSRPPAVSPTCACRTAQRRPDGQDHAVSDHAGGRRLGVRLDPPRMGEHTRELLRRDRLRCRGRSMRCTRSTRSPDAIATARSTRRTA